jgi:hypothetical protein
MPAGGQRAQRDPDLCVTNPEKTEPHPGCPLSIPDGDHRELFRFSSALPFAGFPPRRTLPRSDRQIFIPYAQPKKTREERRGKEGSIEARREKN